MIIHDLMEQGTPEWLDIRRGKFTASIASKLLTPTGKVSISFKEEMGRIIAETLGLQEPEPFVETFWMGRGKELEAEARRWFSVETDLDVQQVGFIESDSHLVGCSPDGVIYVDGKLIPLEIKVPKPGTHISWLLMGELPKTHIQQVHFTLAITGAPFGYFESYSPDIEPLIVKVERDDYTVAMENAIAVYEHEFKWSLNKIMGGEQDAPAL